MHQHLNSLALSTGYPGQLGSAFDKFQNNLDMLQKWRSQVFFCYCAVFKEVISESLSVWALGGLSVLPMAGSALWLYKYLEGFEKKYRCNEWDLSSGSTANIVLWLVTALNT